jgi:hypothetical protein
MVVYRDVFYHVFYHWGTIYWYTCTEYDGTYVRTYSSTTECLYFKSFLR